MYLYRFIYRINICYPFLYNRNIDIVLSFFLYNKDMIRRCLQYIIDHTDLCVILIS